MRRTLEQIIEDEKQRRKEDGDFGINECKENIINRLNFNKDLNKKYNMNLPVSLYIFLEEFVERTNKDTMFNSAMVLACWELINQN